MRFSSIALFALGLIVPLSGCYKYIQHSGKEVLEFAWEEEASSVRSRAAFDMQCPKEELSLTLLEVNEGRPAYPRQIGVRGCGEQTVYVWTHSGWILNNQGKTAQR